MWIDLLAIAAVAFALRLATSNLELFERFHAFSRFHEDWELDELFVTVMIVGLAFVVFGVRRLQDQRRELALRVAAERHATMLALQDPLTGLPNRRRFYEVLAAAVAESHGGQALMIIDLDGFKQINDIFGHAAGDEALRTVARQLRALGGDRFSSARLGGDEFALLAANVSTAAEAGAIARRLIAAIETPVVAAGVEHRLEVSVGIALIEADAQMAEEQLRRADVALYRAKRNRGSACAIYEQSMDADLAERVRLESELRQALSEGQIVPFYQPIVDLQSGGIIKFEALARWRHPERGDISPSIFIPLAEQRGLIQEITEAIVRQACRDALAWPTSVMLSVNLSPLLLQSKSFGLRLVNILSESGFPPNRLEVEITEQALDGDFGLVQSFLQNLRSLGIRIALDDFGTGYSSLSRLKGLPFDDLKIDRSFVQSMSDGGDRTLFVRTILQLGRGLGLTVTAEGVEDSEQRERLIAEGCTQGQGYLFSPAVSAERVHLLLAKGKAEAV